ncbi:MAG TPA: response regulator transcription factor [Caldimonas sp.]|jgi:DNA-binding NarL/FixJ family response regulator|nr:response regulator transcription factor [Caldimonas sp.]HEX2539803.1 response regulator transcription factor [Caldimonas sp.]
MKALLIDDHPLVLSALGAVLERLRPDVVAVGVQTARAAREALEEDGGFDLILLDLQLGDADGFEVLTQLRADHPATPVIVVSASDSNDDVSRAIFLGAMGFVPKRASNDVLIEALHRVMAGAIYVPPMEMRSHAGPGARPRDRNWAEGSEPSPWSAVAPERNVLASTGLTPRQIDVLELLLQGQSNKLIARALHLSVETVKDHVAAVLRSLNVSTRTQAVLAAGQILRPGSQLGYGKGSREAARQG